MIVDYPPSTRSTWSLVLHETLAFMATALLYPFGMRRIYPKTPRVQQQRTVVLVHGYLCNPAIFLPMSAYLRHRGIHQILPFAYPSTQGVERGAIALRAYLREHVRGGEIDLVCHSLGGLVARSYLQELGGARRVERCVTLGTPHFGTYNAYWLASRVGREMRPDSVLLRRLQASQAASADVNFLSIIAGSDNLVIPRVYARHEREVCVPDLGHMAMMYSPAVWRLVSAHLLGEAIHTAPETAPPPTSIFTPAPIH
jgi:pimeloyl-ACP methyl ester carboxylesterase